jgi:hypothetical protein
LYFLVVEKMKKTILIFFGVLFLLYSCKKDDAIPNNPGNGGDGVTHFSQRTLDYCFFKPGTWWVYVDSVSGLRDSVYVTSSLLSNDTITEQDQLGYTGIFEQFYVYMSCSYLNYTQKQYAHSSFFQNSPPGFEEVKYYRYRVGYTSGVEILFSTKFQNGFTGGDWPGLYTSLGFYDSLKVGNIWYKDVAPFYNDGSSAENQSETYLYFAKNIGLIQREIVDSTQKWQLINYSIVQ